MSTRTNFTFGVFILVCFLAPGIAVAQVLTVPIGGKPVEIVEIAQNLSPDGTLVTVYEVPMNRRLVITDLIITGGYCGHRLNRDRGLLLTLCIPAGTTAGTHATFAHTFATGIEFEAGQTLDLQNSSPDGAQYYLRGYLTKPLK